MRNVCLVCGALLLVAACTEEHHYTYPPPAEAPMAPSPPAHRRTPPPQSFQSPAPRTVKPLAMGLLTAKTVGNYMDGEERELRADLRASGAGIGRPGDAITLYLRDDMVFQRDSTALSERGARILLAVASVAAKYDSTLLTVNGYTDTAGTPGRDVELSQARAEAVAKALRDAGVSPRRIAVHGLGAAHLKVPTGPNVSEPRNRRVEIVITPIMAG